MRVHHRTRMVAASGLTGCACHLTRILDPRPMQRDRAQQSTALHAAHLGRPRADSP
jgi:hypothetical protein